MKRQALPRTMPNMLDPAVHGGITKFLVLKEEGCRESHNHGHRHGFVVSLDRGGPIKWTAADLGSRGVVHRGSEEILVSLHFLDPRPAALLASASKTITPQQGIYTIPLSALASLTELFYPEDEPASIEAQETNVLMAEGEITVRDQEP